MPDYSFFFLTSSSISAVLLGICVSLRSNAFSGLLHPNSHEVKVGDRDYKEVLKRSGRWATIAGGLFVISTLWGSGSYAAYVFLTLSDLLLAILLVGNSGLFMAGIVVIGWALLGDFIEMDLLPFSVNMPERDGDRPETEPVDSEDP